MVEKISVCLLILVTAVLSGCNIADTPDSASVQTSESEFAIIYNLRGGSVSDENPAYYNESTNDFILCNPSKNGYEFLGWTGTGLTAPSTDVRVAKGNTGTRVYKANWKKINYSISYNIEENINPVSNPDTYSVTDSFTLENPVKDGYEFTGWTGTGLETPTLMVTIQPGTTGERCYTANFIALN